MTGRRFALVAGFALLCVMALSVVRPDNDAAGAVDQVAGALTIELPAETSAGSDPTVVISSPAPDGTLVELYVVGAVDTQRLVARLRGGQAMLPLPSSATEQAGEIIVVARVGVSTASTTIRSIAKPAVDPVVPLVGPRTIIADADDMTMVVLIPSDSFGNAVVDGTEAVVSLTRPGGREQRLTIEVDGGIAAALVRADTVAGRVALSAAVDGAVGPSHVFEQVAGQPASFTLAAPDTDLIADGFSLHQVETADLVDEFGNELPDGIAVEFVVDGPGGRSLLASTVQAGRSRTALEAPTQPGEITVFARVSGRASDPLVLLFAPAVAIASAEREADVVSVGPVVAERGGYVADGTGVDVVELATGDVIAQGSLRGGHAAIRLSLGAPTGGLVATVLGTEIPVRGS